MVTIKKINDTANKNQSERIMNRKIIIILLLSLVLTACATGKGSKSGDAGDGSGGSGTGDTSSGIADGSLNAFGTGYSTDQLRALGIEGNPLNYKIVYFQYNSIAVDERSRIIIGAHARAVGGAAMTLSGHADERGTRDFNLALGERRAQTVADLMSAEGARSGIQTISYGEERPADSAHNESAWGKNRRVEISY